MVFIIRVSLALALTLSINATEEETTHCFKRVSVGERLIAYDVTRIVERNSVQGCEEECNIYKCTHFSFGTPTGGNGTCELTTDRQVSRRQDPDFELYEKTNECVEGKPTGYEETCYRRISSGKRLHERFIRHSLPCNSLEACQHQCSIEKHFDCQGFNIRLDSARVGRGICELSSIASTYLDPTRDFVFDPEFAYYERDRGNESPSCGPVDRTPNAIPPHHPEENTIGYQPPISGGPYYGGDSYGPWSTGHGTVDHGPWGSRGYGSGFYESNNPSRGPAPSFPPNTPFNQDPYGYAGNRPYPERPPGGPNYSGGKPPLPTWGNNPPPSKYPFGDRRYDRPNRIPTYIIIDADAKEGSRGNEIQPYRPDSGYLPARPSSPPALPPPRPAPPPPPSPPRPSTPPTSFDKPPGYYPPGQLPPSSSFDKPPGYYPPGQLPPSTSFDKPPGYYPPGQLPPSTSFDKPPGYYPPGQLPSSTSFNKPPGYYPPGSSPSSTSFDRPPGYYPPGQSPSSTSFDKPPGYYPPGQLPPSTSFNKPPGYYRPGQSPPSTSPNKPFGFYPPGQPPSSIPFDKTPGYYPPGRLPPSTSFDKPPGYYPPGQSPPTTSFDKPPGHYPPRLPDRSFGVSDNTIGHGVCFRREHPGYKLDSSSIKGTYDAPTVLDCEVFCAKSPFKCTGYSFRYSTSGSGTPNCLLTDFTSLNREIDLLPDRSCDVYFKMGTCADNDRMGDTECFLKVASNRRLDGSKVAQKVTVGGMSDCELACLSSKFFTCRSFSFRHGPAVIGEPIENCFLSDWPISALTHLDFVPLGNNEVYERGSFGHGCELDAGSTQIGPRPPFAPYPNVPQGTQPKDPWGVDETWRHFTVSGWPCRAGTECQLNPEAGFWACEVEGGDRAQWDYCCRPKHSCGFSRGYNYPWCYVGEAGPEQWRPCSEYYYPDFGNRFPYKPVQSHNPPPVDSYGPPTNKRPWNFGEDYGPPSFWPISYIYAEPPPNETYVWDPEELHEHNHHYLTEHHHGYMEEGPRIKFKPCGHKTPYPRAIIQKLDLKDIPKAGNPGEQLRLDENPRHPKKVEPPQEEPGSEVIFGFSPGNRDKENLKNEIEIEVFPNATEDPGKRELQKEGNATEAPADKTKEVIKAVEEIIQQNSASGGQEKTETNETLTKVETAYPGFLTLSQLEKTKFRPRFWN